MAMTEKELLMATVQTAQMRGMTAEQIYEIVGNALEQEEPPKPRVPEKASFTNIEYRITDILKELGVPAHIKGFRYVRKAIQLVYEDQSKMDAVTKVLYPEVAQIYKATSSRVERAIRHAIETAWEHGNLEVMLQYFGNTTDKDQKPTNSEFIAMIADNLILESQRNID